MTVEDLNAPTGAQPNAPAETIATDMASLSADDAASQAEALAVAEEPEAGEEESAAPEQAEAEQQEPAKPDKLDWREKRRIEETNKRRAAEAERDRLKAELEALRNPKTADTPNATQQTPEQIRAAAVAEAKAELAAEQQRNAFAEATGRVLQAGITNIPGFEQARAEMVTNFGDQLNARPDFFDAIVELENGHEVFYQLAKDPEQTEQLLSLPPVKMALKIAQLGATAKPAPEAKPISKAPAPVKPVAGVSQTGTRLDDASASMDTWAETYLKQMAGKGR